MKLTTRIIRSLLLVLVCCWASSVKPQTVDQPTRSTIGGIVVYSDTGRPVRHARVTMFSGKQQERRETLTDLRGRFEFGYVTSGKYLLLVEAPGLVSPYFAAGPGAVAVAPLPYPDVPEAVTQVSVNGRDPLDLKIKALRGGVITGKVLTEDDRPVANAEVRLLRRENGKWVPVSGGSYGPYGQTPRADATGVYRIAGVPSGDYLVRATEPSSEDDDVPGAEDAYSDGAFMIAYYPAATRLKDAEAVSVVTGSESTGIDIRMAQQAAHTITGTVTFAFNQNPAGYVEIIIERSDEPAFIKTISDAITRPNKEGQWRISGLPPGEYVVTVKGGAINLAEDGSGSVLQALRKQTKVRLQDEKVTVLNTTLTLGAQILGKVESNGVQPDTDSLLAVGVILANNGARPTNATEETDYSFAPFSTVQPGSKFSVTGLEAGTYWLWVTKIAESAFYVKSAMRKGVDLMRTPIKLTDDFVVDDVVVTLATDLASVEGQVMLPESTAEQQTPGYATVLIAPADEATLRFNAGTRIVKSDAKGKLVFRSAPGEYFIVAISKDDYYAIQSQISNDFFKKHSDKLVRIKLRAGERVKDLRVPMIER